MKESDLHKEVVDYIKDSYPSVLFNTDSSGIKLNAGQASLLKKLRNGNGYPDITIYEPSENHSVMFLELKKESPYKKDGTLYSNEHLEEQQQMIFALRSKGYSADFYWDIEVIKKAIDEHLKHIQKCPT